MSSYKNEKEEAAVGGMDLNALVDDLWKGFKKICLAGRGACCRV